MSTPRKTQPARRAAAPEHGFDLDAAHAAATRDPFPFTWKGKPYTLKPLGDLGLDAIEAADTGEASAIRAAIVDGFEDPAAAEAFLASKPGITALTILFEQWLEHSGLAPGESGPSSGNSESTVTQFRPTSSGAADA